MVTTTLRALACVALCAVPAFAQQNADPQLPAQVESDEGANDTLKGLGFGVALAFQWNVLKPDIVTDAMVDGAGIVRVARRSNTSAGFMAEMHYFPFTRKNFGHGPFIAAQPGTSQIIESIGMGWMLGWKLSDESPGQRGRGFGLGFGYAARPSAQVLGDEFVEGQPAPMGTDGSRLPVRLQHRDKGAVLVVSSFVF